MDVFFFLVKAKQIFYFGNSEEKVKILLCVCVTLVTVFNLIQHMHRVYYLRDNTHTLNLLEGCNTG